MCKIVRNELAAILAWILFLGVVFGYVRLLSRSIKTLPTFLLAALLFQSFLLPFYLYQHDAFGRKEINHPVACLADGFRAIQTSGIRRLGRKKIGNVVQSLIRLEEQHH